MTSIFSKKIFAALSLTVFFLVFLSSCLISFNHYPGNMEVAQEYAAPGPSHLGAALASDGNNASPHNGTKYSVTKSRFRLKRSTSPAQQENPFAVSTSIFTPPNFIFVANNSAPILSITPALKLIRTVVLLH